MPLRAASSPIWYVALGSESSMCITTGYRRLRKRLADPFDRCAHVPQTASATRIPHLARTTARLDVCFHPLDSVRCAVECDFGADVGFVLAEAVADRARARRLLLPDRHADIPLRVGCPVVGEVHDVAPWVGAKPVRSRRDATQRRIRQDRLDGLQFNR